MSPGCNKSETGSPQGPLIRAVREVLRPLVGLLLDRGLTYPWLSALLKAIYVDVANREFRLEGKAQTDSRVTLLTGVHRKDVRKLREDAGADESSPETIYLGAQLVALWIGDKRYLDKKGLPKPLPRFRKEAKSVSFEGLVTSVSTDIRPRAVLDEWLRLGIVELDDDRNVVLKNDAFIPSKGFAEKAYYLGRNVHDHLAAARANVGSSKPPFLERSVYYDRLSPESVDILNRLSREEAGRTLQKLNRKARELQTKDRKKGPSGHRMNYGVYFYSEPDLSEDE